MRFLFVCFFQHEDSLVFGLRSQQHWLAISVCTAAAGCSSTCLLQNVVQLGLAAVQVHQGAFRVVRRRAGRRRPLRRGLGGSRLLRLLPRRQLLLLLPQHLRLCNRV